MNLLDMIYGFVERLMLSTDFNADEIEKLLDSVRHDLDAMRAHYAGPAPAGTEAVGQLMLESLTLFDESFDEISQFLQDQNEDRLRVAVARADEANDILSAVEEIIQINKHVLSEMVQA